MTYLADLSRIKGLLNLSNSDLDTELLGFISAASRFLEQYTDREYHFDRRKEQFSLRENSGAVMLRVRPIDTIVLVQEESSRTSYDGSGLPTGDSLGDLDSLTPMTGGAGTWGTVTEFSMDEDTGRILLPQSPSHRKVRVVYDAGYVIDFGTDEHTLPEDISTVCEKITIKLYKQRENGGYSAESFQDGRVQFSEAMLDKWSKAVLNSYRNYA